MADAAKGKVTQTPAPTDRPITQYQGVQTTYAGAPSYVILKSVGSKVADNDALEAKTLVNFIDQQCK